MPNRPVKVAVTGAAGQIGYSLLFRIAVGRMFGYEVPVELHLLEIPQAVDALKGVVMELEDCAFPMLRNIVATSDLDEAFGDVDAAILVGSMPRKAGMERSDLLAANGKIFTEQGAALNRSASRDVHVCVVGNPANTNCLIAMENAPDLKRENFTSMTRLDLNRLKAQVARRAGVRVQEVSKLIIWGNHSATQYPDVFHAKIYGEKAMNFIKDEEWVEQQLIPDVQQRGAAIIKARGLSSAASAASAVVDHMHDWYRGTGAEWTSMGVPSDGSYGIPEGIICSYPVFCIDGTYRIVHGLTLEEFSREKINASVKELFDERAAVKEMGLIK